MVQRVMSFFCQKFIVSQCRKLTGWNLSVLCFRNNPVAKTFSYKRGGGVSRFSVKNVLSHTAEKFRRGTFWCFTIFSYRKASISSVVFLSRFCVSKCRKKSQWLIFVFYQFRGSKKFV